MNSDAASRTIAHGRDWVFEVIAGERRDAKNR
jgi:hypothetical protein